MKRVIQERKKKNEKEEMVRVSEDLVRDFAEFSGLMMNEE
jgi:hypothetical protein